MPAGDPLHLSLIHIYYVYVVEKIIPGNQRTLAQSQTAIKQQLTSTKEQAALTKFVKEFKKKWSGKTECRSGYVVMDLSLIHI